LSGLNREMAVGRSSDWVCRRIILQRHGTHKDRRVEAAANLSMDA
jgi:hypothetical protein